MGTKFRLPFYFQESIILLLCHLPISKHSFSFPLFIFIEPPRPSARLLPTSYPYSHKMNVHPLSLSSQLCSGASFKGLPHLIPIKLDCVLHSTIFFPPSGFLRGPPSSQCGVLASSPGCRTGSHMLQLRIPVPQLRPSTAK